MEKDIVINGVSLKELKQTREKVRQGANELIAENIQKVTALVAKIAETEDKTEIEGLSEQAYELLDNAKIVAGITGVTFFLPYSEEYGGYESDEILSSILENNVTGYYDESVAVGKLYNLLTDMEYDTRNWHSSTC